MATRYVMYSRSNYQLTTSCQNCRGIHLQASDSIPEAYLSRCLALNLWSLPQVPPVDVPRLFPPSTLSRYHYSTINSLILITIADNSPSDPTPKSHPSLCLAFALLRHYPGTIDPLSTHWFSSQSLTIHPQIPCQSPTCQCTLPYGALSRHLDYIINSLTLVATTNNPDPILTFYLSMYLAFPLLLFYTLFSNQLHYVRSMLSVRGNHWFLDNMWFVFQVSRTMPWVI